MLCEKSFELRTDMRNSCIILLHPKVITQPMLSFRYLFKTVMIMQFTQAASQIWNRLGHCCHSCPHWVTEYGPKATKYSSAAGCGSCAIKYDHYAFSFFHYLGLHFTQLFPCKISEVSAFITVSANAWGTCHILDRWLPKPEASRAWGNFWKIHVGLLKLSGSGWED